MSLILCIETGTGVCSVALARDGQLIALRESGEGRDHARKVAVFADELLKANRVEPHELDAVAVSEGPGSYTGLRIGVSFAKGLCYALGKPLVAVGSLESLARVAVQSYERGELKAADWSATLLCPMIDARRMEVYTRVFDTEMNPLSEVTAEVVTGESFGGFIGTGREFLIFGDGAAKCVGVLPEQGVRLIDVVPSASGLCSEAQRRLDAGDTVDIAYFEPMYLKDFVVTTSRKKVL